MVGQGKLGDETKKLYEHCLAICRMNEGPDGINTVIGNNQLGNFHLKVGTKYKMDTIPRNEHLCLARTYFMEAKRVWTKIRGPGNNNTEECSFALSVIARDLSLILC
jgi:hypothetical protein